MTVVAGIDVGSKGALALVRVGTASVIDMPLLDRKIIVRQALEFLAEADVIVLEQQQARPTDGGSSSFQLGFAYGQLYALCSTLPAKLLIVHPSRWKRDLSLWGQDKEKSRELALRLFPALGKELILKKHEGRAEALLLAHWGTERWRSPAFRAVID